MNPDATNSSLPNILIVDDTPANLRVLTDLLSRRGYCSRPAPNGKFALQAIELETPDLILLDVNMPDLDGYTVCQRLKADPRFAEIPVIFVSALTETFDKVRAFQVGGVDYITKPIQIEEVQARIETHLKLRHLSQELERTVQDLELRVQEQVKEISDSQLATIFALAKLAESRDDETGKHLDRVRSFCYLLAQKAHERHHYPAELTESFTKIIYQASPLHDIGKVGIPDRILLKPGKLTPPEFEIMKQHSQIGAETLQAVSNQYPHNPIVNMGIKIARSHHERWDGNGYPDGLAGEDIPLPARIMTVADIYDALRSRRIYKPAFSHADSCEIILNSRGSQLDPLLVDIFYEIQAELEAVFDRMKDSADSFLMKAIYG